MRGMLKTIGIGLVATLLLAAAPAKAQLANGGFDIPPYPLDGWTATAGVSDTTTSPQAGPRAAIFYDASAVLSQSFTAAAGTYILSFWLRNASSVVGPLAAITYMVNGATFSGLGDNNYQLNTATVTLNAGVNANLIQFSNAISENGRPVLLDSISLTPVDVPVPLAGAGAASFIAGLAGLGMMARSRRRSEQASA